MSSALVATASTGQAQPSEADKAAARNLVSVGDEHLAQGDYERALEAYRGADEIMRVPTTGIEVARTLVVLGRLREAERVLARFAGPSVEGEPEAFARARERGEALLAELKERIPVLTVVVEPEVNGVHVTANGRALRPDQRELRLDPGRHTLSAIAPEHQPVSTTVQLRERSRERAVLALRPVASAPLPSAASERPAPDEPAREDTDWTPMVWTGGALAAAGALAGGVTGGLSLAKVGDADERCPTREGCDEATRALVDEAEVLAHVSTASLAVAGAGVALGLTGLVLELSGSPEQTVSLSIGPRALRLEGRF